MIPTFNAFNPFFSSFAGALDSLLLSNAPALLGMDGLGLVAQIGTVDKAGINATND